MQVVDLTLVEAYTEALEDTTGAVHLVRLATSAVVHDVNGQHAVVGVQVQFITAVERRLGRGSDDKRVVVGRGATASRVLERVRAVPGSLKVKINMSTDVPRGIRKYTYNAIRVDDAVGTFVHDLVVTSGRDGCGRGGGSSGNDGSEESRELHLGKGSGSVQK